MIFLKIAGLEKLIIGRRRQFLPSCSSCTDGYYGYSCFVGKIVEHCFDKMKEKLRAEDRGEMKFQERWPEEMHEGEEELRNIRKHQRAGKTRIKASKSHRAGKKKK